MHFQPGAHVCTSVQAQHFSSSKCRCVHPDRVLLLLLQVGMGTNNTLFALEDGLVRFTKEVYVPAPRSLEATRVITKLPKGAVLYKTFINVVPVKQEGKFKLVDMV